MTQPDLVSKLMEFVRAHNYGYLNPSEEGKPGHYWCLCGWEGPDRSSYWKHLDEALLVESLLGREGQAAQEALCGTASNATISTNEAGHRTAMDVSPSEELLSRPHRIVSHEQMESVLNAPEPNVTVNPDGSCSPSTPIQPEKVEGCAEHNIPLVDGRCPECRDANGNTFVLDMQSKVLLQPSPSDEWWKAEALDVIRHARVDGDVPTWDRWRSCIINGLLGAFNRGQDSMRASVPSTPIVPGTAGLSAFEHSEIVRLSSYPNNGVTVAEYVETLLGAAKPADPGVPLIHGRVELDVHDARIRKDALEEAAKVADQYPTYRREDQSKGSAVADAIRALAERPAPAGEVPVSKPVKMQVRYCGHEVPVGEICPECYPHAAGEVKGEK